MKEAVFNSIWAFIPTTECIASCLYIFDSFCGFECFNNMGFHLSFVAYCLLKASPFGNSTSVKYTNAC